jgi:hypothetical protein
MSTQEFNQHTLLFRPIFNTGVPVRLDHIYADENNHAIAVYQDGSTTDLGPVSEQEINVAVSTPSGTTVSDHAVVFAPLTWPASSGATVSNHKIIL